MNLSKLPPVIRRVSHIRGHKIALRDVVVDDAPFILALRTNPEKSAYISPVSGELSTQVEWIERYREGVGQAYFIIEDLAGVALGTVRLYDAQGDSFCWGSWILRDGAPTNASIESALIVYRFAIETLGFSRSHFQVNRLNSSVYAFHERFGAVRVAESEVEYEYTIELPMIEQSLDRYRRFLPNGISVCNT